MEEQRKSENALVPALRFEGFSDPWEQRKAGDRLVVLRGGSPRPIESYITSDPSGVNWIKIGDVEPGSMYITRTSERIRREGVSKSREVFAGDLLLSNSMSFGRPYILQVNGCIHDGWLLIRDAEGRFDTIFLQQMLSTPSMARQYKALAAGGVVNNLNSELVQSATIAFPGKAEQIKIGALFQKLDSLIALHQRKHEKLKTVKQSLLEKMFPKEGEDVPEIRFEGFTDPWEQRTFDEFVYASGSRNADNLDLESHSVSNTSGFVPQSEQFENGGTMAEADKTAYWIVEPGSFAYNPARINVGSIGYLATRENVIVSSLYEVFRSDETCDDRFLWHWLKSALFAKQIEALQEGGVRLYFFFDKLLKSEITMPSIREQSIIGSLFDRLDSLIALHQRERVEACL